MTLRAIDAMPGPGMGTAGTFRIWLIEADDLAGILNAAGYETMATEVLEITTATASSPIGRTVACVDGDDHDRDVIRLALALLRRKPELGPSRLADLLVQRVGAGPGRVAGTVTDLLAELELQAELVATHLERLRAANSESGEWPEPSDRAWLAATLNGAEQDALNAAARVRAGRALIERARLQHGPRVGGRP